MLCQWNSAYTHVMRYSYIGTLTSYASCGVSKLTKPMEFNLILACRSTTSRQTKGSAILTLQLPFGFTTQSNDLSAREGISPQPLFAPYMNYEPSIAPTFL